MSLHRLLLRQLNREGLNEKSPPAELRQWQQFLERISNTYDESDRERYLLERSMDISSRELLGLNEKLENAQHLAQLGYWYFDRSEEKLVWSKELYHLFGLDPTRPSPSWDNFLQMIHEKDRTHFVELVEKALNEGNNFECEARIQLLNDGDQWYYFIGHTSHQKEGSYALSGIAMNIARRKKAEEEVALLHQQLLVSARCAGMADVATVMLHNVGNILNSVNVSVNLLQEYIQQPYYKKLFVLRDMLKDHLSSIVNYLSEDPQGKLIPPYFIATTDMVENDYGEFCHELSALGKHIAHIKEIVAMQQTLGGVSGIKDKIFLPEAIDTALLMSVGGSKHNDIIIDKNYKETPFVVTDKIKLLQILINIIQNAKDAIVDHQGSAKKIVLSIKKGQTDDQVRVVVTDQGNGIKAEDITKIFSFGFTTKKNGHGFGLHSSALAAKEIGGTLTAESDGAGCGAIFTLTLPLNNAA